MLLIATDEAGYGPKLGPLVIVATAWNIPGESLSPAELARQFQPLQTPQTCLGSKVVVDDSKAVYKPTGSLGLLHAVVSASHHWCGNTESTLQEQLPRIAPDDLEHIEGTPWLRLLSKSQFLHPSETSDLLQQWRSTGIELVDVRARVVTAKRFNMVCASGCNKADLLSESTLGLAKLMIDLYGHDVRKIAVFCDRHGGRKYYGGVLQHVFPDAQLQIAKEEKQESEYRLSRIGQQINIFFTVKGDSFTPVALSSMHAKYLRERFMESFNEYFAHRHAADDKLTPTAGYPTDADRFLADVAPTLSREKIIKESLVRLR